MEELSTRLVRRGLDVTVYCRSQYTPREQTEHRGVRLVVLPTLRTKHLDTPVHTLFAVLHAGSRRFARRPYDAALVVNGANALFVPLLRAAGVPTALHVDGIERRRAKWGLLGSGVYAVSERLAPVVADALITDAQVIDRHYREHYGKTSLVIPYGVDPTPLPAGAVLEQLGLQPRRYFLYVSRFEPENNPHRVVEAYRAVAGELPLVMVGGAPYARRFIAEFQSRADPRVRFPGPIYLVEAMGYGNCALVNDTEENREVAGEAAIYFEVGRPETLTRALTSVLDDPERARERGGAARERAFARYSWERVCDQYEALFRSLGGRPRNRTAE
jgi:glycosyltransferase involved in cell wall biosynthesis